MIEMQRSLAGACRIDSCMNCDFRFASKGDVTGVSTGIRMHSIPCTRLEFRCGSNLLCSRPRKSWGKKYAPKPAMQDCNSNSFVSRKLGVMARKLRSKLDCPYILLQQPTLWMSAQETQTRPLKTCEIHHDSRFSFGKSLRSYRYHLFARVQAVLQTSRHLRSVFATSDDK